MIRNTNTLPFRPGIPGIPGIVPGPGGPGGPASPGPPGKPGSPGVPFIPAGPGKPGSPLSPLRPGKPGSKRMMMDKKTALDFSHNRWKTGIVCNTNRLKCIVTVLKYRPTFWDAHSLI